MDAWKRAVYMLVTALMLPYQLRRSGCFPALPYPPSWRMENIIGGNFFNKKKDNKAIGPAGKSGFQPKKCSLKNVKISLDMGSTSGFRPLYSSE
jgi:hypothetical protein